MAAHWIAERQIGPAIVRYGADSLKREFLPAIAAGDLTFCVGMSESEAGSDLARVRTVARRDGSGYRVTGTNLVLAVGTLFAVFALLGQVSNLSRLWPCLTPQRGAL